MKRIVIEAVSQAAMRPPYNLDERAGDWIVEPDGNILIRATGTDLSDPETFLFAFHELVECFLCHDRGITQEKVDSFDKLFGTWPIVDQEAEPGDHPASPYRRQHRFACLLEFLLAHELGLRDYGMIR